MSKKRRKSDQCLNCGYQLDQNFDYCPKCGQENDDRQVSFGRLITDFFSNYFSLDSKFGRSIKPFFLQPGVLTREFMEGKRVKYANPIRLYLVVSLIHFFLFSINMDNKKEMNNGIIQASKDETSDTSPSRDSMISFELDSAEDISDSSSFFISEKEWNIINHMTKDDGSDYSIQQIEDSIHNERKGFVSGYITHKVIKLMKSDVHSINMYIVSKIPGVMFFLLPIYALLLKIFFRKKLYINHLIHSLHIHSFAFVVLSLLWLLTLVSQKMADTIEIVFPITILIYIIFSFKNAYLVKLSSAIFKVLFSGFIYTIILTVSLIIGVLVSLLLY